MKLWLASTDASLVARHFELGLFVGVLTNPTTLSAAKRPPVEIMRDLCAATTSPVFYQLNHGAPETMKRQADALLANGWKNLGIKVPLTREGCVVLAWLRTQSVSLRLATAVPTTQQVLLADALDVPWITPAGSVLEKLGGPPKLALLSEMQLALDRQRSTSTPIPSFASPAEMQALALAGVRAGFIWDRDVDRFVDHELVQRTVAGFDSAWHAIASAHPGGY
jgi:transaldolase